MRPEEISKLYTDEDKDDPVTHADQLEEFFVTPPAPPVKEGDEDA